MSVLFPYIESDKLNYVVYLIVCGPHSHMVTSGAIVLCPPLRDLHRMLDCEMEDWKLRCKEYLQSGKVPCRTAPQVCVQSILRYHWPRVTDDL